MKKYTSKQEYAAFYWDNNIEELVKWVDGLVLDYDKDILIAPCNHLLQQWWNLELWSSGRLRGQWALNEVAPQWVVMDLKTNRFFVFEDKDFKEWFSEVRQ